MDISVAFLSLGHAGLINTLMPNVIDQDAMQWAECIGSDPTVENVFKAMSWVGAQIK